MAPFKEDGFRSLLSREIRCAKLWDFGFFRHPSLLNMVAFANPATAVEGGFDF